MHARIDPFYRSVGDTSADYPNECKRMEYERFAICVHTRICDDLGVMNPVLYEHGVSQSSSLGFTMSRTVLTYKFILHDLGEMG